MRKGLVALVGAFAIIALAIGPGLSFAQSFNQPLSISCASLDGKLTSVSGCIDAAIPLSGVGILISLSLVALAYMLGELLHIEGLKGWYKTEIWETAKSLMLVASIFSILVILSGIAVALAGSSPSFQAGGGTESSLNANLGGPSGLYAIALSSYVNPALSTTYNAIASVQGLQNGVNGIKGTSVTTWLPLPIPIPIGPGSFFIMSLKFGSSAPLFVSTYISGTNSVSSIDVGATNSFIIDIEDMAIAPTLVALTIIKDMFSMIVLTGLSFFLPAGIILRSVPFLRSIGGTLVAIGITLAIIFPAMLVVINVPVTNFVNNMLATSLPPPSTTSPNCNALTGYTGDPTGGIFPAVACGLIQLTAQLILNANNAAGPAPVGVLIGSSAAAATANNFDGGFYTGYFNSFNSILPALNFVTYETYGTLLQMFLLIFDMVIGIIIAGAVASALGGKLRLGFGKIKLT